jgi:hypothetical protein
MIFSFFYCVASQGGLKSVRKPSESGSAQQSFTIHTDAENVAPVLPVAGAKEWGTAPGKQDSKENSVAASQWGRAKMGRKQAAHVAMNEVSKLTTPSFQVHEDEADPSVAAYVALEHFPNHLRHSCCFQNSQKGEFNSGGGFKVRKFHLFLK